MLLLLACPEARHELHNGSLVSEQTFLGFSWLGMGHSLQQSHL